MERLTWLKRPMVALALLCGVTVSGFSGVSAQEASPVAEGPGLPPPPENCTVVAEGLWAPRFVAVGDDGSVYVTESGYGGDEVLNITPPGGEEGGAEASPAPQLEEGNEAQETASPVTDEGAGGEEAAPPSTRGYTGQVTKIDSDGNQSVLTSGLPSYSDGVGPHGIVFADGQVYVATGGAGVGVGIEPLPEENSIYRIDPESGEATIIASLGQYEVDNNPDGTDVNPNLYSLVFADGQLYVSDAGGNTIYQVDPESGEFELFAVVPMLSELVDELPENSTDRQPVPTGLAVNPAGGFYVGLLSEGWPEGAPSILTLDADGNFEPVATGLGFVTALHTDDEGVIHATQLTTGADPSTPGNVVQIDEEGNATPVVENLVLPHGTASGEDGSLYVAVISINIAPAPIGQVLQCDISA